MRVGNRVLESEAMETIEEVRAYDQLTRKYLRILHNGFVETLLNKGSKTGNFLEVGSGSGHISIGVARYNDQARITGIDLSANMIQVATENSEQAGVSDRICFQYGSATEIPFEDNSFDTVYCHNMLHHIPEPYGMIKEMKRVLKPGGGFFVRDLIRVPEMLIPFHVHILGLTYTPLMKKEYRDSICAALSEAEWFELFQKTDMSQAVLTRHFITHQGMEKQAQNRRENYFSIPTPLPVSLFKNMYVSRPVA